MWSKLIDCISVFLFGTESRPRFEGDDLFFFGNFFLKCILFYSSLFLYISLTKTLEPDQRIKTNDSEGTSQSCLVLKLDPVAVVPLFVLTSGTNSAQPIGGGWSTVFASIFPIMDPPLLLSIVS